MPEVGPEELRELTKTLDRLRRYLMYERIMALSKLYAWWAAAGLVGGGISLAIGYAPISGRAIWLLQAALWLTIGALITRAFSENVARIRELSRTLSAEPAGSGPEGGWEYALAWALAFAAGVVLAGVVGRWVGTSTPGRIAVGLCSALGLGNLATWALNRGRGEVPGGEPAVVGAANLASIPLLLSMETELTQYVSMLLVISLSYAWASLSYALRARRVLTSGA